MSLNSLRRRLRSHVVTAPVTAIVPIPTAATTPMDSKALPPDFHSSAAPSEAANAHSPATSFIPGVFGVSLLSII